MFCTRRNRSTDLISFEQREHRGSSCKAEYLFGRLSPARATMVVYPSSRAEVDVSVSFCHRSHSKYSHLKREGGSMLQEKCVIVPNSVINGRICSS